MTGQPVVEIKLISKHFGEGLARVDALREVSLDVSPRNRDRVAWTERLGKEHIAQCNRLHSRTEFREHVGSTVSLFIVTSGFAQISRGLRLEKIGFIFQSHNLLPFLNAWENVAVARVMAGASLAQAKARALELLTYLGIERRKNAMPGELSGGRRSGSRLPGPSANDPRIILADEPTAALNSQRAGTVMDMLRKVATERQTAVIVVTHDEKIFDRFDHIYSLRDGAIEQPQANAA